MILHGLVINLKRHKKQLGKKKATDKPQICVLISLKGLFEIWWTYFTQEISLLSLKAYYIHVALKDLRVQTSQDILYLWNKNFMSKEEKVKFCFSWVQSASWDNITFMLAKELYIYIFPKL